MQEHTPELERSSTHAGQVASSAHSASGPSATVTLHGPAAAAPGEPALRASEARYRRLFESAKDGILIVDADTGLVIDVNPYLADLLGYRMSDFIGKQLWDFVPFKDVVASKGAYAELQARDYAAFEDIPLESKDGRQVPVGFVSNIYLVDGKRTIQCNIRDHTERKAAERTRLDLERQLRVAQKLESIGRLAGGIAHDFNNLLAVVVCHAEFALAALPLGSPSRTDLLEVERAAERAAKLVHQLLAFSRQQLLQPTLLDLNKVVAGLDHTLRRLLGEHIELVPLLAPDPVATMADPSQIERVIVNLVLNARDAMPDGGQLVIRTANVELDAASAATHADVAPGSYVMLAVRDTGCGIDALTQARMFEPFFTTKGAGKGTGLGLATVFGIVTQSGGSIGVDSAPGQGTTFEIHLPRAPPGVAAPPLTDPKSTSRTAPRETILIAEDDDQVRHLTERILVAAGYEVLMAENGRAALALYQAHAEKVALVLSDVVMPEMGGPAFVEELRRRRPTLKVLFMSGYSDDASVHDGLLETHTRFISKPFHARQLTHALRELLDEPALASAARLPA